MVYVAHMTTPDPTVDGIEPEPPVILTDVRHPLDLAGTEVQQRQTQDAMPQCSGTGASGKASASRSRAQPQLRLNLSKLTVTVPLAFITHAVVSWAVITEPSEPEAWMVRVNSWLALFSFMLKLPHTVACPL